MAAIRAVVVPPEDRSTGIGGDVKLWRRARKSQRAVEVVVRHSAVQSDVRQAAPLERARTFPALAALRRGFRERLSVQIGDEPHESIKLLHRGPTIPVALARTGLVPHLHN